MKKRASLLWAFRRIGNRIPAIALLTCANIGSSLLGVAFALGTRNIIDTAVAGYSEAFSRACLIQGAIILGILLCITVSRHLRERLTADLDRDWKKHLLNLLLHGDYPAVSKYHSGELLNRMNNDVRTLDDGLLTLIPGLASIVTKLIGAFIALYALEPWFAAVLLLGGLAVILVTTVIRRRLKGLHKRVSEEEGKVSGFLQEALEKLLMVQAMDVASEIEKKADIMLQSRFNAQRKRKNVTLFANSCISIMSYAASFIALVWCAFELLQGRMSFGSLTAVTQLVSQLQGPLVNLSGIIPQYIATTASAERLMELESLEQESGPMEESADALYARMDAICGIGLHFSYDRDRILENASFSLPKGAFAVITGPSGIGKSTLLKLLLGIFRPEQGGLYLRCADQQIPLDRSTRRLFAYVPQGNLLLSGTLRENLVLSKPDATETEILQATYVSGMDEFLPQLPRGLETVIGENGAGLSEGQSQRLAIARAVLSGAPILLLDECTSALDAHTEALVLERIHRLPDRTCIAVTHRNAAIELSDWNLQMDGHNIHAEKLK